jgi:galactokinase
METARTFSAPGRVNIIGEHTDYNEGLVLPAAVNRRTVVKAWPRGDRRVNARSDRFESVCEFDLDVSELEPQGDWFDHLLGLAAQFRLAGYRLAGADLSITSNVPNGAGLASSAALSVAAGYALLCVSGFEPDLVGLARAAQQAEQQFVGTQCGLMDQLIACFGVPGAALMIDCRSLQRQPVPIPAGLKLVVADSMIRHKLATSKYNERRSECEEAVRRLNQAGLKITSLRDVDTTEELAEYARVLPENLLKRSRHVVSENRRVGDMVRALSTRDLGRIGALMLASHASLRDDYEVSIRMLDVLVEAAAAAPGFVGGRMTGGGFGGCTVNLVREGFETAFCAELRQSVSTRMRVTPEITLYETAPGVMEELPA